MLVEIISLRKQKKKIINFFPRHAPGGEYEVKTKTLDRDGRVIACVDWYFEVTK